MIRRLFVLGTMLGFGLLLCTQTVRAQCTGYSATITPAALAPGDVAARGGVAITLTSSRDDGALIGHKLTVGPGTGIKAQWVTLLPSGMNPNTVTVALYYAVNGGSWTLLDGNEPLNGSDTFQVSSTYVGKVFDLIAVAGGSFGSTQDINYLSVVNAPAGVYATDYLPTNAYTQVTINFGGGSMMNNCSICQLHPNECIGKTHTPYVSLSATNHTSGESQLISRQIAGNQANESQSVSGKGSIWISVLPGDTVDGTANAEIFCTMFGDLPVSGNDEWGLDWELAWTKFSTIQSSCLPAGGNPPSIGCKVTSKYMCNTNSQPADLQVNQVFAEYDTNGNPVTLETVPPFWWGWGFGIRGKVAGFTTPWIFPANVLQQYKVGDMSSFAHVVLEIAAGAFPSNSTIRNCTNKDKGTSPETFPPLDQP